MPCGIIFCPSGGADLAFQNLPAPQLTAPQLTMVRHFGLHAAATPRKDKQPHSFHLADDVDGMNDARNVAEERQ